LFEARLITVTIRFIALLLIFINTPRVFAWNDFGHMAIAAIAYPQLSAPAKQRVSVLLQKNPDYAEWVRGVPPAERERIAFMKAAVWPDAIKRNPDYSDIPDRFAPALSPNSGYRDKLQHRSWHYINNPFTPDRTPAHPAATPNLQTQIATLRRVLREKTSSMDTQSYSLVWLLHLVGDAHQPLHATSRFTRQFPHGDQGGNAVILCQKTCNLDLHAYWDRVLGTTRKPRAIFRMIASYPVADKQRAAITDETVWIQESMDIAQHVVYSAPITSDASSTRLTGDYKATARNVARQQAAIAGARLANLLNQLLANTP
jgi:hypothetical protein